MDTELDMTEQSTHTHTVCDTETSRIAGRVEKTLEPQ